MPAYDYRCPDCDTLFEVTRRFSDKSEVVCPVCGVVARRVFTPVGVHFKGTGFYNTDYKHTGAGAPVSKDASSAETPAVTSEKKEPATEAGSQKAVQSSAAVKSPAAR